MKRLAAELENYKRYVEKELDELRNRIAEL